MGSIDTKELRFKDLGKRSFVLFSSVVTLIVTMFMHTEAYAFELVKNVKGTMNVSLKETSSTPSALPDTGDFGLWLAAILLLAFSAVACFVCFYAYSSRVSSSGNEGRASFTGRFFDKTKMSVLLVVLLFTSLGGGFLFATHSVQATGLMDSLSLKSAIVVDERGNIIENKISFKNNTVKDVTLESVEAPQKLSALTFDNVKHPVKAGGEIQNSWNKAKISLELIDELRRNNSEMTFDINCKVAFESDAEVDTSDVVYDGTQWKPEVSEIEGLEEGKDYEIEYGENINAGEGTVSICGIGEYEGITTYTFNILPKEVTVPDGILAEDKVYDKTTKSTLATTDANIVGVVEGDELGVEAKGSFTSEKVDSNVPVEINKLSLSGADANNYVIAASGNQTSTSANITPKMLNVTGGVTAEDKTYDGTQNVVIDSTNVSLEGVIEGDSVTLASVDGLFEDKNAGNGKSVNLVNGELEGDDSSNYLLAQTGNQTIKASIFKKEVTIGGTSAKERVYVEGDTSVEIEGTPEFSTGDICLEDDVEISTYEGSYENPNAEDDKLVNLNIEIEGEDASNYKVSDSSKTIQGNILSIVKFVTNTTTGIEDQHVHFGKTFEDSATELLPDRTGLTKEGWYLNPACAGDKWDFGTTTVTENVFTLYANWTPTENDEDGNLSFWISPSYRVTTGNTSDATNLSNNAAEMNNARDSYVKEEWNVLKSSTEVQLDIKQMEEEKNYGTAWMEGSVTNEYKALMKSDKFHLYTKYNGGATEADAGGLVSELNGYVEFRIIEVGEHFNTAGNTDTGDGSRLTFMATHVLPTAYQMNSSSTNEGGWGSTTLRESLQKTGAIASKFNTSFTDAISRVGKHSNDGGAGSTVDEATYETDDLFWVPSWKEIAGSAGGNVFFASNTEGAQYAYFENLNVNASGNNPALTLLTRSSSLPASVSSSSFAMRSPKIGNATNYLQVGANGEISDEINADSLNSVALCFSLGLKNVYFLETDGTPVTGIDKQRVLYGETADRPSSDPETTGKTFAGWYKDPGLTQKCFDCDMKILKDTNYYAKWINNKDISSCWLQEPKASNPSSTAAGAINDKQIYKEVNILRAGEGNMKYASTKETWVSYMTGSTEKHLYTTYSGGETEQSSGGATSAANKWVEFRILEVGEHYNVAGDSSSWDGSIVSFMATHTLPTAYASNSNYDNMANSRNKGGWPGTTLRPLLQAGGEIYNKFPSGFCNSIATVVKKCNTGGDGNSQTRAAVNSNDKFWLISYSEIADQSGSYNDRASRCEGAQYQLFKMVGIKGTDNNDLLKMRTRAGANPGNNSKKEETWWYLRSPNVLDYQTTLSVNASGNPSTGGGAYVYSRRGIVPCFAF